MPAGSHNYFANYDLKQEKRDRIEALYGSDSDDDGIVLPPSAPAPPTTPIGTQGFYIRVANYPIQVFNPIAGIHSGITNNLPHHAGIEVIDIATGRTVQSLHGGPAGEEFLPAISGDGLALVTRVIGESDDPYPDQSPTFEATIVPYVPTLDVALGLLSTAKADVDAVFGDDTEYEVPLVDGPIRGDGGSQNSNSVATVALESIQQNASAQGMKADQTITIEGLGGSNPGHSGHLGTLNPVGEHLDADTAYWVPPGQREFNESDPIFVDLNGDGSVFAEEFNYFDWDKDGTLDKTAWVNPEDALLVFDLNIAGGFGSSDGKITSADELVFTNHVHWSVTDLHALRAFDYEWMDIDGDGRKEHLQGNKDGMLSAADGIWDMLKLWQDANGDAVFQDGELLSLSDVGITSIALGYNGLNEAYNGHFAHKASHFRYSGADFADDGIAVHGVAQATTTTGTISIVDTSILSLETSREAEVIVSEFDDRGGRGNSDQLLRWIA